MTVPTFRQGGRLPESGGGLAMKQVIGPARPDGMSRRHLLVGAAWAACCTGLMRPSAAFAQQSGMWGAETQEKYSRFMVDFAKNYDRPIDCADLALRGLIEFAHENRLPVRLFYFAKSGGRLKRRWYGFKPGDNKEQVASLLQRQLGAANVIDNTAQIEPAQLRPGDMIMTYFPDVGSTGHTRVVIRSVFDDKQRDWLVAWMQGSLPPIIPEEVEQFFGEISTERGVPTARRWRYGQFTSGA